MKSTPLYPAMPAPHFVLRGAIFWVSDAFVGCASDFRRGFCIVIVAMRQNPQQLCGAGESLWWEQ
jgi:hypothetical protein